MYVFACLLAKSKIFTVLPLMESIFEYSLYSFVLVINHY